jgi:endonuclease YncB( thermonuclease family)
MAPGAWRARLSAALPWMFVLGMAAGTMLPVRHWLPSPWTVLQSQSDNHDSEGVWRRAGTASVRHPVEVLYTIDGDTFDGRVHLWPGLDLSTRVRLRGIDAPERKAQCADEQNRAETATEALRGRLVATKHTPNVSTALRDGGYARAYTGGHRDGWCGG